MFDSGKIGNTTKAIAEKRITAKMSCSPILRTKSWSGSFICNNTATTPPMTIARWPYYQLSNKHLRHTLVMQQLR
jgi:hypothetical protein